MRHGVFRSSAFFARSILVAGLLVAAPPLFAAVTITGIVTNEAGAGQANVDIDLVDQCSGVNVFLFNDKTAFDGTFSVTANPGTYDIRFTPPAGSTVAAHEIGDTAISANTNLGTIVLHPGFAVSGVVRDTSAVGIAGISLRFVSLATGKRVYVTKNTTSASGTYSARVRPGTYDIEYRPPSTTTYLTVRRKGVVVASDVSGLVDTLGVGLQLSGTVRGPTAAGVQNVNLDLYEVCTGEKQPTAHDTTDASGVYSIYVPPGTYSIHYKPSACKGLGAQRLSDQVIDQSTVIDASLPAAFAVSGRVLDNPGQPVEGATIKFYVGSTRQGATDDDTSAAGAFSVLMAPGSYGVNVEPPVGRDLLVAHVSQVNVSDPVALGDIHLQSGIPVTGVVHGPGGVPVENVDINAVDSTTRSRVRLAHDSTAADGTFRVIVPPGTYEFQYGPPSCTGLAPTAQKNVTVGAPYSLPLVQLVAGVHATGKVVDTAAAAVELADLDFYAPGTQDRFYVTNDITDAAGRYDLLVQPGTYDIVFKPPVGTHLRPVRRTSIALPGNTTLTDTVLPNGWIVSGAVLSSAMMMPVSGVAVDFFAPGSTSPILVSDNLTPSAGDYAVVVDAGTWDVLYTPPAGSGLAPRYRRSVAVASDVQMPDTLLEPLTAPSVTSVSPASGTTPGGQTVTVGGSGFQADATVQIGGIAATSVVVASATNLTCVTPAHPPGSVGVSVSNPGNQVSTTNGIFTYVEPAGGGVQNLRLAKSGSDVVLTWATTGQASYTVFRNATPTGFTGASVLGTTSSTTYTHVGGILGASAFYLVE